ncbi:MAG: metallophosphoesterase [Candidatus Choladocola sp.]|nr:metallophosphoesterase [Candidatus Choladocola sp.]
MRVLVISDTHGREDNLRKVLDRMGLPDCVIHLGDAENGEAELRRIVNCPLHIVAGNCDFFSSLPVAKIVEIGNCRIMITHGHYYYVSVGTRDLVEEAKTNGCNVAMFGHTHRPFVDQSDPEITVLNPGSLSFPRQDGRRPSYIIMKVEEGRPAEYSLHYL